MTLLADLSEQQPLPPEQTTARQLKASDRDQGEQEERLCVGDAVIPNKQREG